MRLRVSNGAGESLPVISSWCSLDGLKVVCNHSEVKYGGQRQVGWGRDKTKPAGLDARKKRIEWRRDEVKFLRLITLIRAGPVQSGILIVFTLTPAIPAATPIISVGRLIRAALDSLRKRSVLLFAQNSSLTPRCCMRVAFVSPINPGRGDKPS